jgi:hypothetical protein
MHPLYNARRRFTARTGRIECRVEGNRSAGTEKKVEEWVDGNVKKKGA